MADEKTQTFILGGIITAVLGIYGFFLKHIIGHADKDEISGQLKSLWDEKQSTKTCDKVHEGINVQLQDIKENVREIKKMIESGHGK